eukprot:358410-Chlamydomonas_euryale.AAC.3
MLGIRRIQSSTMRALMPIMLVLLAMLSGSVQSFNYTVRTNFPLTDFSQNQVSYGNATALLMQLQRHRVSQDGEEFRLYNDYFCGAENGTFLEMGALDGILLSNTYALEQGLNWGGVLIEANPVSYRALARNRPSAITIRSAVCATDNIVTFCQSSPQISGIWEFMSEGFKQQWYPNGLPASTIQLPCVPLSRLLHLARITHYNFFSLDVEGAELQVLKSINWQLVSFEVIVVEASNKEGDSAKTEQVRELLMHHGYKFDKHVHRNDCHHSKQNGVKPMALRIVLKPSSIMNDSRVASPLVGGARGSAVAVGEMLCETRISYNSVVATCNSIVAFLVLALLGVVGDVDFQSGKSLCLCALGLLSVRWLYSVSRLCVRSCDEFLFILVRVINVPHSA